MTHPFQTASDVRKLQQTEAAKALIGEIVRYGDGPSALMRVTHIAPWGGVYGEQYFGGSVLGSPGPVRPASQRDLASWRWAHDSNDKWIPGRYSYQPPSHVILSVVSPQGRSYCSKPLSRFMPYKLDQDSTEAETYQRLIVQQGARIVGRWFVHLKNKA